MIKKLALSTVLLLGIASCGVVEKTVVNRQVESEQYGKVLLGKQTLSQFQQEPYGYVGNYLDYL
ncbi:hypothetical protein [Riemerella anatipestifer]|uniref:hypothetical protein n=1 Tax=Riemerella anatipestifer TaxID=34085 RepID=UPI0021A7F18B|nr:hypothetical protein [Riemerella anatipestifer]UWS41282.1 hypothetical protein N1F80_01900 [Riemerella anatipestifer]